MTLEQAQDFWDIGLYITGSLRQFYPENSPLDFQTWRTNVIGAILGPTGWTEEQLMVESFKNQSVRNEIRWLESNGGLSRS